MQNAIETGLAVKLTAPTGGVVSGGAYLIGGLLVIAAEDAAETVSFSGVATGVFEVDKAFNEAWTEGEKIYFDATASPIPLFTNVIGSPPLTLVGAAVRAVPLSLALGYVDTASPPASPPGLTGNADAGTVKVETYTDVAGSVLTVTVNGVSYTLTEGSGEDYLAETSDNQTATNLAAAMNAKIPGITASPSTDTVTITLKAPSTTGRVRLDGVVRA